MKLAELTRDTGISCPKEYENIEISGIAYDSRNVKEGFAFVCISGFKKDGHDFAASAIDNGASVIFTERKIDTGDIPQIVCEDNRKTLSAISANFFENPTKDIEIFGVTGTNGKTTIAFLIRKILEEYGKPCGLLGTISYSFGKMRYDSSNTTPESYAVQSLFSQMKKDGAKACSMEVSSHALALSRVADVEFNYAVFTNLTPDHMDFHKDFEDYYLAKKKLFYMVSGTSVINIDDKYGRRLFEELKKDGINVKSFGLESKDADYCAEVLDMSARGSVITVKKDEKILGGLKVNTPGNFSVSNALAAAAVCMEAGVPWKEIASGIADIKGVPGRFERVENDKDIDIIVDYAHTPDALVNVLNTAREITRGRLISVFGCGGDRDKTKRPLMGEAAAKLSDYCIVTSDNPRTENPVVIIGEVVTGVKKTSCEFDVVADRHKAIQKAVEMHKPGDVIVIAGKGHEDYQIVGTEKHHFDDREEAMKAIEMRFGADEKA